METTDSTMAYAFFFPRFDIDLSNSNSLGFSRVYDELFYSGELLSFYVFKHLGQGVR